MKTDHRKLPDNPKEALEQYVFELKDIDYDWYDKASRRNKYFWVIAQITAVVCGFATAIVAALIDHLAVIGLTFLRVLLITLPIVGSFAATLLVQTRALERKLLRERGRQTIQGLIEKAKADFAAASGDEDFTALHQQLIADVQALEANQAMEFVKIAPGADRLRLPTQERHATTTRGTNDG